MLAPHFVKKTLGTLRGGTAGCDLGLGPGEKSGRRRSAADVSPPGQKGAPFPCGPRPRAYGGIVGQDIGATAIAVVPTTIALPPPSFHRAKDAFRIQSVVRPRVRVDDGGVTNVVWLEHCTIPIVAIAVSNAQR